MHKEPLLPHSLWVSPPPTIVNVEPKYLPQVRRITEGFHNFAGGGNNSHTSLSGWDRQKGLNHWSTLKPHLPSASSPPSQPAQPPPANNESASKAPKATLIPAQPTKRRHTPPLPAQSQYLLLRLLRHVLHDLLLGDVPAPPAAAPPPASSAAAGVRPGILAPAAARVAGGGWGVPPAAAPAAVAAPPTATRAAAGVRGRFRVGRGRAAPPPPRRRRAPPALAVAVPLRHVGDGRESRHRVVGWLGKLECSVT